MIHMNGSALAMMGIVWLVIIANVGYCFYRLLTSERNLSGGE